MRINIVLALLLVLLCGSAWAQPTPPATPPSPESMGIQPPSPTSSAQAPPASESSKALVPTTQISASAAAPSTMAAATTKSTYMIVPPGTSTPNQFYIPYYPSTVASCYFGQWVPMWLDVKGYGPLYSYEWYPNGKLVSQYLANVPYPSWQKMWFNGDATGWHTLQYYCNGWSNYVYVYVYEGTSIPGPTPTPQPPTPSCTAKVVVSSPYSKGFSVYVDGNYVGGDGLNGDPLDGYYTFYVTGNQQHNIKVNYQGGTYSQTKTYNCGSTYAVTLSSGGGQPLPPYGNMPVYTTQLPAGGSPGNMPVYTTQLPAGGQTPTLY